jgi:hypothetical protein
MPAPWPDSQLSPVTPWLQRRKSRISASWPAPWIRIWHCFLTSLSSLDQSPSDIRIHRTRLLARTCTPFGGSKLGFRRLDQDREDDELRGCRLQLSCDAGKVCEGHQHHVHASRLQRLIEFRTAPDELQVACGPFQRGLQSRAVERCTTLRSSGVDQQVSLMRHRGSLKPNAAADSQKLIATGEDGSSAEQG